ncbi:thiamine biosynthesis lipoprotein ApbE precursor [bacterium BMS3Abin02]|nr:thiamine biosynthesis lipoprotein ApbE precursor [bacterium BMS3Abin02]
MISRRSFLRDMLGVVAGAGLVGLPVWEWTAKHRRVDRYVRAMMGTDVEIVLIGLDRDMAASVAERAFTTMEVVASRFTIFDPASELNSLNATAGSGPVRLAPDLETLLVQANRMRARTEGAFTPSILPLSRLWRPGQGRLPAAATIEEALDAVTRAEVRLLSAGWGELTSTTGLDLGGIAKGFAVDRAVRVLREAGVTDAIVDAGGDLRLLGSRDGRPWRVGIPDPLQPEQIARVLFLRDAAVATSGDYERFFVVDGVRYHHIVDPRTGYPASATHSFTAVLPDGMSADSASTAGFVLGPEPGLEFVAGIGGEALAVDTTGAWVRTGGLDDRQA